MRSTPASAPHQTPSRPYWLLELSNQVIGMFGHGLPGPKEEALVLHLAQIEGPVRPQYAARLAT